MPNCVKGLRKAQIWAYLAKAFDTVQHESEKPKSGLSFLTIRPLTQFNVRDSWLYYFQGRITHLVVIILSEEASEIDGKRMCLKLGHVIEWYVVRVLSCSLHYLLHWHICVSVFEANAWVLQLHRPSIQPPVSRISAHGRLDSPPINGSVRLHGRESIPDVNVMDGRLYEVVRLLGTLRVTGKLNNLSGILFAMYTFRQLWSCICLQEFILEGF